MKTKTMMMMRRRRKTTTKTDKDKDYFGDEVTMMRKRITRKQTIVRFPLDNLLFIAAPDIQY